MPDGLIEAVVEGAAIGCAPTSAKGCLALILVLVLIIGTLVIIDTYVEPEKTKVSELDGVITYRTRSIITGRETFSSEKLPAEKPVSK